MLQVFSKLKSFLTGQELLERERRRAVRLPCRTQCRIEGAAQPATVHNLSVLGMLLECSEKLRKDKVVTLEALGTPGHPITARVVWCSGRGRQWVVGLMFIGCNEEKALSWVRTALDRLGANQGKTRERRAHVRVPAQTIAYLSNRSGERLQEGHMRNIGLGGALFLSEVEVPPGTEGRFQCDPIGRLPGLDEEATVRSCRQGGSSEGYLIGMQFAETGSEAVRKFLKSLRP